MRLRYSPPLSPGSTRSKFSEESGVSPSTLRHGPSICADALDTNYGLTFGFGIVQGKVEFGKISNLGLRNIHADNFAMSQFSVIRNSLHIVIADTAFLVGGLSTCVSSSRSQLMIVASQNLALSFNKLMLIKANLRLVLIFSVMMIATFQNLDSRRTYVPEYAKSTVKRISKKKTK
jgi:hypothetical protein